MGCNVNSVDSLRRRAKAQIVSFRISLLWPIHIINPFDTTDWFTDTNVESGKRLDEGRGRTG